MLLSNGEREELIILLLLERLGEHNVQFNKHLVANYNTEAINDRYIQLLDMFLNEYALDTTEKSE